MKLIQFPMHNKSIKTSLMRTREILPVTEIDPRVKMHSEGSTAENDLPNLNDLIFYIDKDNFDSLNNNELAKSIANFVKGYGANTTELIQLSLY